MSADGKNCECGRLAIATLRRRDERPGEPICGVCVKQLAPGFVQMMPRDSGKAEVAGG
ncbi:hypothetical protein HZY97_20290 [Sphingomonas sp. R-74633]|uniref:hypothetical protein n=1 Tax=Sphingomonas sp. R-74633 TaxID=2751188 RepID=UPI0015D4200B|nr:hypothetical protein [Sphingomonas sp. R-74633]NYT43126.1 hypothetical protein [Sphingomonas sp. R-74633]